MDRFPVSRCAPIFDAGSERSQIEHPAGTANKRIPFGQRPTCTVAEAYDATGLGRTKLYELIGGGQLDTVTIGRRRLVRIAFAAATIPSLPRMKHFSCVTPKHATPLRRPMRKRSHSTTEINRPSLKSQG